MTKFKGIRQDRLKVHFLRPKGAISRRELLKLVIPRYEVIPFIEPMECRGYQACGLCVDTCPVKAIKVEEDEVAIDTTLCSGCGACVEACPHRAIVYPTFSLEEIDKKMKGLLFPKEATIEPRIIAAVCQKCLPAHSQDETAQIYPDSMLRLGIPCLAMVSPWLILRAFDMGAQGFALISGTCRSGFDSARWRENIRFIQELFNCWDIEPERIMVFDVTEDEPYGVEQKLSQFAGEIARLGPTPLSMAEPTLVPAEGLPLPALVRGIASKLNIASAEAVSTGIVPLGKVELDSSQCTGCGLCALDCPTEALVISSSEETDAYQLLFKHDACVACGRCVEVCPEKCLRLERILELDRIDSSAVLFEDKIVRCRECGSPIGSKAMIDKLQAKVLAAGQSFPSQFELCPMCKTKASSALGGLPRRT